MLSNSCKKLDRQVRAQNYPAKQIAQTQRTCCNSRTNAKAQSQWQHLYQQQCHVKRNRDNVAASTGTQKNGTMGEQPQSWLNTGQNVSMHYNASAKTQVPPNSFENKNPMNILDNSQHMPEDIHQSKPKLWTLKHHAETFQILQFKPNDIQLNKSWRLSH